MSYRGLLIGCGFFAENHMHGWCDVDGADIVAVCDRDEKRAWDFAKRFNVPLVYTDAETALRATHPDFTDVATTVESHRELVEAALNSGSATICQKPFAETLEDAYAMVSRAKETSKPLFVHENFRWQQSMLALRDKLEEGVVGRTCFARVSFRSGYDVYAGQPYLAEAQRFTLMDVGLHLFDVSRFLLGDAENIHCRTQSLRDGIAGEDAFFATLQQLNGAIVAVDCSYFTIDVPDPFPQVLVRIEGSEGTLEVVEGYRLRLIRDGKVEEWNVEPDVPSWGSKPWHGVQDSVAAFERHVVRVLNGQEEPAPSGAHNLSTLAMALAAYRSAETGETVDLETFKREAV